MWSGEIFLRNFLSYPSQYSLVKGGVKNISLTLKPPSNQWVICRDHPIWSHCRDNPLFLVLSDHMSIIFPLYSIYILLYHHVWWLNPTCLLHISNNTFQQIFQTRCLHNAFPHWQGPGIRPKGFQEILTGKSMVLIYANGFRVAIEFYVWIILNQNKYIYIYREMEPLCEIGFG